MLKIFRDKKQLCNYFFDGLKERLSDIYEEVPSCNNDFSRYLCIKGSSEEITYNGKPELSLRVSDHWSWYSSTNKCENKNYAQCFSKDFPRPHKRKVPDKASEPIKAASVCLYKNGEYKVIFGEIYDRKKRSWGWINDSVDDVISYIFEEVFEECLNDC